MIQALLAGVSGIQTQQTNMNTIGNNLANTNTTGFKGSRTTFEDLLSQTFSGATGPSTGSGGKDPVQIGLGVKVAGTEMDGTQGSLSATGKSSDLAIQGSGFFAVSNGTTINYTRDGSFNVDSNGDLVHGASGQRMLGWEADSNGNIDTSKPLTGASVLNIPQGAKSAAQATSKVSYSGNLNSNSLSTDTWSTTVKIYDAQGNASDLTLTFKNHQSYTSATAPAAAPNAVSSFDWTATIGSTTVGQSSGTGNSPVYFDSTGTIQTTGSTGTIAVPAPGGTTNTVTVDLGKLNSVAQSSSVGASSQNGFAAGSLTSYSIGSDGVIAGSFSNGLNRKIGQIALSTFTNPNGLTKSGSNLYAVSQNSGAASAGTPSDQGKGAISAGYLEQSNVDMSTELTSLIVAQRAFQANTKIITTVDEMLQDLVNIKR